MLHPQFENIPAKDLTLWRVFIPFDEVDAALPGLKLENSDENGIRELKPMEYISLVFPGGPAENYIHIIVQPPVTG